MSLTYFLQIDGPGALVKIGRSINVKSRLASIQTGLPWATRIVAIVGADVERDLKKRFASDRVSGEWFRPTQALADWLQEAFTAGRLVRLSAVDGAYINAVIKPRLREYLGGRDPLNNPGGDLVRCILNDLLPTLHGREKDLFTATKGHITLELSRGYGPTLEAPHLMIPEASSIEAAA